MSTSRKKDNELQEPVTQEEKTDESNQEVEHSTEDNPLTSSENQTDEINASTEEETSQESSNGLDLSSLFDAQITLSDVQPPSTVMVFPMDTISLFPGMIAPTILPEEATQELTDKSKDGQQFIAFFAQKNTASSPQPEDLYEIGVVARVVRVMHLPDGSKTVLVQATNRCKSKTFTQTKPFMIAQIEQLEEDTDPEDQTIIEALSRNIHKLLGEIAEIVPSLPNEFVELLQQLDEPGSLADFIALQFGGPKEQKQELLAELNTRLRMEKAFSVLLKETELIKLQYQLRQEVESKVEDRQREYLLREQLKLIHRELGETPEEAESETAQYARKIAEANMPEEAEKKAKEELRRLQALPAEATEYNLIRTYLDWLCVLPWSKRSESKINIRKARTILERDHYGLERVKERIIEFLAVHKLKPDQKGAILCLCGPPGVGKTSLGKSIAEAMGREFFRFSVGGMRDESEIKGHRRTYVGAMPGKLLQALKRVQTRNPVIMLDEIDKIGKDHRGDPASALLEALDPAQNNGFLDHYLDLPFDLSEVMFIATANYRDAIPAPMLDRMEVIQLTGYIPEEKVEIARRYLLPRQRKAHGLTADNVGIAKTAIGKIVREYTREAGVRNLEREIGSVCRKVATRVAEVESTDERPIRVRVRDKNLENYLGKPRFSQEQVAAYPPRPGRALGLAWTPVGGDILAIEVTQFPGKGKLELTGKLGDVMSESSHIALSYLKSQATTFGIDLSQLKDKDLHLHVPAGAVPKDGPSAGITITTAFLSLLKNQTGKSVIPNLAMTGEITLMGDVLPVGGIREKVVAAAAAGVETVILPKRNEKDLSEVPDYIQEKMTFHFATHYDDVFSIAFDE